MKDTVYVEFKDGLIRGVIGFDSWGAAMGFIFGVERKERFDPKGRYARIVG